MYGQASSEALRRQCKVTIIFSSSGARHILNAVFDIRVTLDDNPRSLASLHIKLVVHCGLPNRPQLLHVARRITVSSGHCQVVSQLELAATAAESIAFEVL